jgi:riboflavin kinase/FMN adenylyltransferase
VHTPLHFTRLDAQGSSLPAHPRVVAIGNFDGVHRGHQHVLAQQVEQSPGRLAVLTFDPHPAAALGRAVPKALTALSRKAELLVRLGVGEVLVKTFDDAFAALSPERFVLELLVQKLGAQALVVGRNFRFGRARGGDLALLQRLGEAHGFEVRCSELRGDERGPFSSTRVREALARGDIADASHVLGRPHAFSGVVVRGAQRGRTLGFPTANVDHVTELVPARGVYAVVVDIMSDPGDGRARALGRGVMNVGVRPTVDASEINTQEVHLFDMGDPRDVDLYDATLRVHVIERIRDEQKFSSLDALRTQITADATRARTITAPIDPTHGHDGQRSYG